MNDIIIVPTKAVKRLLKWVSYSFIAVKTHDLVHNRNEISPKYLFFKYFKMTTSFSGFQ